MKQWRSSSESGRFVEDSKTSSFVRYILNCVYDQGKEMDIEGKSGINTLRIVLNEIFMTNYEMLDNPEKYLYQYK